MKQNTLYVSMTTGEIFDHRTAINEWLQGDTIGVYIGNRFTGCEWVH